MTYAEIESAIREQALSQPRGWQSRFAKDNDITRQQVYNMIHGLKPITPNYIDQLLEALDLTLELVRQDNGKITPI
jgi:plasmid maintenance system antidote protein VapI